VTLQSLWKSVPSHLGFRDRDREKPTDDGTTFLITESEGNEGGAPFIRLNDNSTLSGVVLFYPLQKAAVEPEQTKKSWSHLRRQSTRRMSGRAPI
jgi:hypothetical protein